MNKDYEVSTIAGCGELGFQDGNALEAKFYNPFSLCCSKDGRIYVVDPMNNRIRMIYNNQVTTIAGTGIGGFKDGNALEAMFYNPGTICCSADGPIYVTDTFNNRIRMIHNDQVTTIAGNGQQGFKDGNALEAMFCQPVMICISNDGRIYVADSYRIRMIHNGQVTTIAGSGRKGPKDGNALNAMFAEFGEMCISKDGRLYVVDRDNHRIRMIYNNKVTRIAGNGKQGFQDGNALESRFYHPWGICCSEDGRLYVIDQDNNAIRMIYNDQVTTIAGNGKQGFQDGKALESMFRYPTGICCSEDGKLYVADRYNQKIRMICSSPYSKSPFGFALLLDMQNGFCDRQISLNGITYHLHSALVNVRCPLLFDQDHFGLIEKSNISNKSFDSFVTFLYSNKLTREYNQSWPKEMSVKSAIELIFLFDLLMDCKWVLTELKTTFRVRLIETLTINQQEEAIRNVIIDLLPFVYHLKELIKARTLMSQSKTKRLYTEHCYNILVHELQQRQSIVEQHISFFDQGCAKIEAISIVMEDLVSRTTEMDTIDDESKIVFEAEMTELSKLAFSKTNMYVMDMEPNLQSSMEHLDEWTRTDFVIKLSNDDIEYHVHKLIVCGRWKYFCQMIESGLKEVSNNEMTLTEDWNRSRFEKFMKYIYLNEIDFDELEDIEWLIESSRLYGITIVKSLNGNEISECATYGFEQLYDYCINRQQQQ